MQPRPRPKKSLLPPPSKKRKTHSAIEEINFDFDARADYLTGFHKRKVLRSQRAQDEAAKKAREERIETRKQLREERRKELEAHVEAVNALLAEAKIPGYEATDDSEEDDGEAWDGIKDELLAEAVDHEEEYIDDDRYTTVTVEEVDVSKEGLHKLMEDDEDAIRGREKAEAAARAAAEVKNKKVWPKKERKQKFRYESKVERKLARGKQKAGNKAKADARRGNG